MNTLQRLHPEQDQSPWIDFIDRALISEGKLERLVDAGAVRARMGDHVLRTSTAGLAAIAALSLRLGRW